MTLLPKTAQQFSSEKYWDTFFNKRQSAFEWYGDFAQLSPILFKYARTTDHILIVGCGNSTLSADLFNCQFINTLSVDISNVVVKQMQRKYAKLVKKGLSFERMDISEISKPDESYEVVLDKGTMDALIPDDSVETRQRILKILREISRVLKTGGRFVCVSLLQEQVLKILLDFFTNDGGSPWIVRIHRCSEADREPNALSDSVVFPVFVVVATKMKSGLPLPTILETCQDIEAKPVRLKDMDAVIEDVKSQQNYAFIRHHIRNNKNALDTNNRLDLFSAQDSVHPRYSMYLVDSGKKYQQPYGIFIVPQGRETEWLFGNPKGRLELAKMCESQRLLVVHLNRWHTYENLNCVKSELSSRVMELAPPHFPRNIQVPFLSVGEDVGERKVCFEGKSSLQGDFIVEDVVVDGEIFRRLVFLDTPHIIQSEVRLQIIENQAVVDLSQLPSEYYKHMTQALAFALPQFQDGTGRVLLLGLGGGMLASYLLKVFPQMKLTCVEIDEAIVRVASEWFSFPEEKANVVVKDALVFIEECDTKGEAFDVVFLDINSMDLSAGLTCPPLAFLHQNVLQQLKNISKKVLAMNFVCRDEDLKKTTNETLCPGTFAHCKLFTIDDDVNEVVVLSHQPFDDYQEPATQLGQIIK